MPFNRRFTLIGMPQPGQAPCPGATRIGMAVVSFTEPPETFIFPVVGSKVQVVRPGVDSSFVTGLKYCGCIAETAIAGSALPEVPEVSSSEASVPAVTP